LTPPVSSADSGLALAQTGSAAPAAMSGAVLVNTATKESGEALSVVDWQPSSAMEASVTAPTVNSEVFFMMLSSLIKKQKLKNREIP
jgi:hypothetical protein